MQSGLFAVIFLVLNFSAAVLGEDVIKRGTHTFMAYLYYQDETVVDGTGARFLQAGVLIRPNFLISSSLVSSVLEDPLSKTLLARLGAIHIDANLTLNEDEDEQEQEIIQIILPHEHNRTHWWASDISILKTLQPFLRTSAVHVTKLSMRHDFKDMTCNILVFKKINLPSTVDSLFLTQLSVEMLPASRENCGEQFNENTMTCASDPQSTSEEKPVADFCQGNSGGPLMCDDNVMALQTYINGNCNPPHLYQLLAPWKTFLSCGSEDNCNNREKCPDVCTVIFKDAPPATEVVNTTSIILTEPTITEIIIPSSEDKKVADTFADTVTPQSTEELVDNTKTEELTASTTTATTATTPTTPTAAEVTQTEISTATPTPTATSTPNATTFTTTTISPAKETERSWPHEREILKKIDEDDIKVETVRNHKIEAQQQKKTKLVRNVGDKNTCVVHGLIYSVFFMWLCLV